MRTIYGIQFQVKPRTDQSSAECIGELRQLTAAWVAGKYHRTWKVDVMPPFDGNRLDPINGHWVMSDHECHEECELVSLEWGHPDDRDDSMAWVTSCVFARKCDAVHAAISIRLSSARFIVRPTRYALGRPKVVSDVLTAFSCTIGGQDVPITHTTLHAPDVAGFVDNALVSKDRVLPVVLVSPDVWTEKPIVNTAVLQTTLLGLAQVVLLVDKWAAFKLTDKIGRELTCFDGAVRIYWPGFQPTDLPFIHPLYLARSIKYHRNHGHELKSHLFRMFAGMSAFRAGELGPIREVRRYIEVERERHLQRLRDEVKAGTAKQDDLIAQIERQKAAIDDLEFRNLELEEKVQQLNRDLYAAQQNVVLISQQLGAAQDQDFLPDNPLTVEQEFETVADAIKSAKVKFPNTLVFLDSALDQATKCPFKDPDSVFGLFAALDELVKKWRTDGQIGTTWKEALIAKGFDYKPDISSTCKQKKLVTDYRFNYNGHSVIVGEHVTKGVGQDPQKCMSVHWHRDNKKKVLVIGRCGKHGRNTLT
jgi:hypothetical protein